MLIDKAGAAVWGAMSLDERAGHIETFKAKLLDRKDEVVSLLVKVGISIITLSAPPPPLNANCRKLAKLPTMRLTTSPCSQTAFPSTLKRPAVTAALSFLLPRVPN
jgi:hypothetical protein